MAFPYEDLGDAGFEHLVVHLMGKLFGIGVESFATGPDGGRDARFRGTAERFPSAASPWVGTTIGQAKHTNSWNMHVSDPEFSGDVKSAILSGEIERIRALRERGELDNYILFTNRRVGATVGTQIIERISAATGISEDQIFLAGIEYIERLLTQFPEVIRTAGLEMFDGPLVVTSKELAEVILGVADALSAPTPASDAPVVERVSLARKNELNGMSEEFSSQLTRNYLAQTLQIQDFLAAPANAAILARYEAAVDDFQLEVIAHRDEFASFDRLFTELLSLLFKRDGVLARHRRLTRAILFYMYWHCDLGRTPDASAE